MLVDHYVGGEVDLQQQAREELRVALYCMKYKQQWQAREHLIIPPLYHNSQVNTYVRRARAAMTLNKVEDAKKHVESALELLNEG